MASIASYGDGRRVIQFSVGDGKRHSLRLGKVDKKQAESAKLRVEELIACRLSASTWGTATAEWLRGLPDAQYCVLERAGLVRARVSARSWTVAAWVADYLVKRTDAKPSTICNMRQAERSLVQHLGRKRLDDLTAADGEVLMIALRGNLAEATARRQFRRVKQFLQAAVKAKLLVENPFAGVKSGDYVNRDRDHYVTAAELAGLLDACPDAEWRLVLGLARLAGLRCPSEVLVLTWADVLWGENKLRVHSVKTEHHSGGGLRFVPICAQLMRLLLDVFGDGRGAGEFIITRYRGGRANLRTQFGRIVGRTSIEPFKKPFVNMRGSCETDWLEAGQAEFVVSEWMGHQVKVARRHYDKVREEAFQRATRGGAESGASAVQNAVQHTAAGNCTERQDNLGGTSNDNADGALCSSASRDASKCNSVQDLQSSPSRTSQRNQVFLTYCYASGYEKRAGLLAESRRRVTSPPRKRCGRPDCGTLNSTMWKINFHNVEMLAARLPPYLHDAAALLNV